VAPIKPPTTTVIKIVAKCCRRGRKILYSGIAAIRPM
jgi:hypothetical protein